MDEYWVCMNINEEELKDGWVYMNMNDDEWRRTKEWISIHEYELRMHKDELKNGWVYMNMNGWWMKKN